MSKIFKYSSIVTAKEIIREERVLLNSPTSFNDPYDSTFYISESDKQKTIDLIVNFSFFRILCNFIKENENKPNISNSVLFKGIKSEIDIYKRLVKKTKIYSYVPFFNSVIKKISTLNKRVEEAVSNSIIIFEKEVIPELYSLRSKAKISCFSERNDSILMWSHYASSHKGICIEFDEERSFF